MAKANSAEDRGGSLVLKAPGGRLRGLLQPSETGVSVSQKAVAVLEQDYPYVYDVLGGVAESDQQPALEPSAITLHVHEGRLRFVINVKSAGKTFRGLVEDPLNPLGSINCALAMGECSQSDYTERKPSSANSQDIPY